MVMGKEKINVIEKRKDVYWIKILLKSLRYLDNGNENGLNLPVQQPVLILHSTSLQPRSDPGPRGQSEVHE